MSVPEKYTDLPVADLPLGGDEIICLVQSGDSKQTPASSLTALIPVYAAVAPVTGTYNDVVLPGTGDYVFDVSTAGGDVTYTGFIAQRDGQKLVFNNVAANALTFAALTGSSAGNQIRLPTDLSVVQNDSMVFQFVQGAGVWVRI